MILYIVKVVFNLAFGSSVVLLTSRSRLLYLLLDSLIRYGLFRFE